MMGVGVEEQLWGLLPVKLRLHGRNHLSCYQGGLVLQQESEPQSFAAGRIPKVLEPQCKTSLEACLVLGMGPGNVD